MNRKTTKDTTYFSLRLPSDLLTRIKSRAWMESQGGMAPLNYTALIRKTLEREFPDESEASRYDPRHGAEFRTIIDKGETR